MSRSADLRDELQRNGFGLAPAVQWKRSGAGLSPRRAWDITTSIQGYAFHTRVRRLDEVATFITRLIGWEPETEVARRAHLRQLAQKKIAKQNRKAVRKRIDDARIAEAFEKGLRV